MIELTKYFVPNELNAAWVISKQITYTYDDDHDLAIHAEGMAQSIAHCNFITPLDRKIVLSWTKMLGEFMHQGPVIVRPGLVLSKALLDTQLNFSILDYHQPFRIMAVDIPNEILGPHGPDALAFVYHPFPAELIVSLRSRIGDPRGKATYNVHISDDKPTIEDGTADMKWADTPEEAEFFHQVCRIAINTCLLAATRQTKVEPLPEKIAKKRKKKDLRLNQLAARHCQQLTFRDLIVYDRVKVKYDGEGTGETYGPQLRSGHWKMVPYGPRHSKRRLMWLNDYWTHKELKFGTPQKTIVIQ